MATNAMLKLSWLMSRRSANDASLLQSAITRDLASQLRPQLSGTEQESLAKVGTKDAEAYQFYLKGRYHFEGFTREDFKAAAEFFDKAVARDPSYAAAYAGLADAYAMQGYFGYASARETFDKSRTLARRALGLDPQIPEAHISLALVDMEFFGTFRRRKGRFRRLWHLIPTLPMLMKLIVGSKVKWAEFQRRLLSAVERRNLITSCRCITCMSRWETTNRRWSSGPNFNS